MKSDQEIATEVSFETLKDLQTRGIERIVCSGGGAKGVVYAGAYQALHDTGIIQNLKMFSGASAGAITATLMAVGMPTKTLREQLIQTNLQDLMGNIVGKVFKKNPQGIASITKDGEPLLNFMRNNIITTIKETLMNLQDEIEIKLQDDARLEALIAKINTQQPVITFQDLGLLNQHFPEQFKQLTISAAQFPYGELQIFNSEQTPDVELALACRASASIPVVLAPVEIEINGTRKKFVDGGVYDNLPADYFDTDNGKFIKNTKPLQTMIFAFGEGLDNKKNTVFQALYGERWDESITDDELITIIIEKSIQLAKQDIVTKKNISSKQEAQIISHAIKKIIREHGITGDRAKIINKAINDVVNNVLLNPRKNAEFWQDYKAYKKANKLNEQMQLLTTLIKKNMQPILYDANWREKIKRDVLIEKFGDFSAPYKNTKQKEIGYQKLRQEYSHRTIELRVGKIKTTDFAKATKVARVMDSLGYLDTINHVTNHELYDPAKFSPNEFFDQLINNFEHIHTALLLGCGKNPLNNSLIKKIELLKEKLKEKSDAVINREIYYLIKETVEQDTDSIEIFALSRAVEFHNQLLSSDDLFKEIYEEGFKRSGMFSRSNVTGERYFSHTSLHKALQNQSMFSLQQNQKKGSRADKILTTLSTMANFEKLDSHSRSESLNI